MQKSATYGKTMDISTSAAIWSFIQSRHYFQIMKMPGSSEESV